MSVIGVSLFESGKKCPKCFSRNVKFSASGSPESCNAKFSKPSLLSALQYSEKINVAFIIDRCVFNCQAERSSARRSFKHQTHRTIFEKNISQSVERVWTYMDFA